MKEKNRENNEGDYRLIVYPFWEHRTKFSVPKDLKSGPYRKWVHYTLTVTRIR